jgi:hypothetical protein
MAKQPVSLSLCNPQVCVTSSLKFSVIFVSCGYYLVLDLCSVSRVTASPFLGYYSHKYPEHLANLSRKISNEIIRRCCASISLPEIFDGNVEHSLVATLAGV